MLYCMYMSWATARQAKVIFSILFLLVGIAGAIFLSASVKKPTCFDGKKNGVEDGVDCGGGCSLQCKEYTQDVVVKWQRSYQITKGFYNAVAYVENQNFQAGVRSVHYKFRLYDADRILLTERDGETFLEPNKAVVVFEQQIPVGNAIPAYTTFQFTDAISWIKTDARYNEMIIAPSEQVFDEKDIKPRFSTVLKNVSEKYTISNIDVYVVAYDDVGNAIQVGKTLIKELPPRAKKNVFVIWQNKFDVKPTRFEIIPRYNPFTQEYPTK